MLHSDSLTPADEKPNRSENFPSLGGIEYRFHGVWQCAKTLAVRGRPFSSTLQLP